MLIRITGQQKTAMKVIYRRLVKIIDNSIILDNQNIIDKIDKSKTISNNLPYINFFLKDFFPDLHELLNYPTYSKFKYSDILKCKRDLENVLLNLRLSGLLQIKQVSKNKHKL